MVFTLLDLERQLLRQTQRACRGRTGYVPVTVLLFDKGRPVPAIADDLGLDQSTVYRYAQTCHKKALWATCGRKSPAIGACSPAPSGPPAQE